MTTEMWVIAAERVLGSLPVLRWPFYGALFAMLIDQSDLLLMNLLHLGGVNNYQSFDKDLDQVYLALFLVTALRMARAAAGRVDASLAKHDARIERNVSVGLYAYRLAGFAAFELTRSRGLLLFFPNLFEFWYLFIAARRQFRLEVRLPLRLRAARRDTAAVEGRAAPLALNQPAQSARLPSSTAVVLVALVALKLFQEYALHQARWLDSFTTVDALRAIWHFVTPF
jgi:hypothetical protein